MIAVPHPGQIWEKVEEEMNEFRNEFDVTNDQPIDKDRAQHEFGDLLFSLINYARFVDINPEEALERTNKKFIKRFTYLESKAKEMGKSLSDMTLSEMDVFWEEAKKK
jgi:XTP/dITP diphosphohydrolase